MLLSCDDLHVEDYEFYYELMLNNFTVLFLIRVVYHKKKMFGTVENFDHECYKINPLDMHYTYQRSSVSRGNKLDIKLMNTPCFPSFSYRSGCWYQVE